MKFFLSSQACRLLSAAPSALGLVWKSADGGYLLSLQLLLIVNATNHDQ